jgi:hypothetical protein
VIEFNNSHRKEMDDKTDIWREESMELGIMRARTTDLETQYIETDLDRMRTIDRSLTLLGVIQRLRMTEVRNQ